MPVNINPDMHNHTESSDGRQSSLRFLLRASHQGKNIVAITDHNSVGGLKRLEEDLYSVVETIEADKSYDPSKILEILESIKILKGTELITSFDGVIIEVLGYNFDISKMGEEIKRLNEQVKRKPYEALHEGFSKIIDENNLVFDKAAIDNALEKIRSEGKGGVVGPFFEELKSHEENLPFLNYIDENGEEKQADSLKLFINKHLYNKQSPLFVDMSSTRPSYKDTIDAIHKSGGVAEIAHPGRYKDKFNVEERIDDMISYGIDGIEVFYPDHDYEFRNFLLSKVKQYDLVASGGSDDHHSIKEGIQYEIGRVAIPDIKETRWMKESIENGKEFIQNSPKIQEMVQKLRKLKEERAKKQEEIKQLDCKLNKNRSEEEEIEKG